MTEETKYFRRPSGGLVAVTGLNSTPEQPPGTVEVSQTVYETELAAIEAARETARATVRAAEQALALTAYNALILVGMPPAAAAVVSGHRPDPEES